MKMGEIYLRYAQTTVGDLGFAARSLEPRVVPSRRAVGADTRMSRRSANGRKLLGSRLFPATTTAIPIRASVSPAQSMKYSARRMWK